MLTMDVFNDDAFSVISMTEAVERLGHVPSLLCNMPGLYEPVPVRTTGIWIEERDSVPTIIQTDERGAPPRQRATEKRKARSFETARVSQARTITAAQLQNIRAFGTETETMALQGEIARYQMLMARDIDLTKEYHLLGLVQGKFIDADGTVVYDWATEFGQGQIPAKKLNLDAANPTAGQLVRDLNGVKRQMIRNLKGMGGASVQIKALCGSEFYDRITQHQDTIRAFEAQQAASQLLNDHGQEFETFRFGKIDWIDYRGTDDAAVRVKDNEARLFPVGAGIFQMAYAPAETFEFVNTLGRERYSWIVRDRDRNAWAAVEMYSYPLPVCIQPSALAKVTI